MTGDSLSIDIAFFAILALIIFLAGQKLSLYGDLLAEKTGLGKAWIGLILMSAVTSLPELMVGISSVSIVGSADLAVGDIFGSCAINLGILSLMDVFTPKGHSLLGRVSQNHILAASLGLILVALAGMGLFVNNDIIFTPSIGITSISFFIIYLISLRIIYSFNLKHPEIANREQNAIKLSLRQIIARYALFAGVIIVAALILPHFAEKIGQAAGLSSSFVGTLLLAFSTSLPEIAVSIAAVKMGSVDLAVGNLLGSNIFNIFILFIDDVFYVKGHLLKDASPANLISVFSVIIMSAVVIIGLSYRAKNKRYLLAWDTLLILVIYIINIGLLYSNQ
ncbi:MAG: hypothetical protein WED33_11280 [Bacteroidia bacterium]